MNLYRTHTCGALRPDHIGQTVTLSGWVARKRDHGGILFIDLRDTYGVTQCVVDPTKPGLADVAHIRPESVVTFTGMVAARPGETKNTKLPTGGIEMVVASATVQSTADVLPFMVAEDDGAGEDSRLKYRFLDLRREKMQKNIRLRNNVIASIRKRMWDQGFQEFQTPILTASSPEGARDFLVPSRLHPGKFYALPQAPQQFKQLLMMSGFDRYFQIAPCFRDEDGRADRSPGEFYQLDLEMSFVTQDDVFATIEPVIGGLFKEFSNVTGTQYAVSQWPWVRIPYREAMLKYGVDKPDLRNPLVITDVTSIFARDDVDFKAFKSGVVRAIRAPQVSDKPRSFFDKLNDWARGEGAPGLGYVLFEGADGKGPIAKFLPAAAQEELKKVTGAGPGDAVFFVCDKLDAATKLAGKVRTRLGEELNLIEPGIFKFCWIVDFPMYKRDETTGQIGFMHNPFSMPQGGLEALNTQDPLDILAYQYDFVCNGIELSSGAIRNHKPEIMERAFAIAGYAREVLETKFGGMLNAMRFGAPPHGGIAPGIDRMVMILANEPNIREITSFPMNGNAEDLMMQAPNNVTDVQLRDLHIKLDLPKAKKADAA